MRKIGIVGGVGWRSTVDYYSEICRRSEEWHLARDPDAVPVIPEVSIESLDLSRAVRYLGNDDDEDSWRSFDEYHRAALKRLESSGVDFALIASNTPHHRFEPIVRGINVPIISIVEASAKECVRVGASEVLILGTALTMKSAKFRRAFEQHGIKAAGPLEERVQDATTSLVADLQLGRLEGAIESIAGFVRLSFPGDVVAQPVVCLACTELPLAFPEQKMLASFQRDKITYINSTAAHIDAALDFALDEGT